MTVAAICCLYLYTKLMRQQIEDEEEEERLREAEEEQDEQREQEEEEEEEEEELVREEEDEEEEEEQLLRDEEDEEDELKRDAVEAMLFSAMTDDEQTEWLDDTTTQPLTSSPNDDGDDCDDCEEYDGSLTPTPSRASSHSTATVLTTSAEKLPFRSIAADRQQSCEQHGAACPSNHTRQSQTTIVTTTPRHITPSDKRHQRVVDTLMSPAAGSIISSSKLLSPPPLHLHSHASSGNKENVSPSSSSSYDTSHQNRLTLKTSPQSAFSAVKRPLYISSSSVATTASLSPIHSSSAKTVSPPPHTDDSTEAVAVSKRRKTAHASLTQSFQSLPVEQSVQAVGGMEMGGVVGGGRTGRLPR